jgi:energy-coupling factor transport system substrate-specific component
MAGRYLVAAAIFGGVQEGVTALGRYRVWTTTRFVIAGVITGVLLAVPMWFAFHVSTLPVWAGIVFVVLFVIGPVIWTLVGLGIGSGLRRAGLARAR